MAGGLNVIEVTQPSREQTEARNDEVEVPPYSGKRVRGDHTNDEVEDPVGRGGEGHPLGSGAQGEDLSGQEPRHGAPREAVDDIVQHNEGVLAVGADGGGQVRLGEGADDAQQDGHPHAAELQQGLAAPAVGEVPGHHRGCGVGDRVGRGVEEGPALVEAG